MHRCAVPASWGCAHTSSEGVEVSGPLGSTLATAQRMAQFVAAADPWSPRRSLAHASRVVYVPGAFDLLHEGHVELLEKATTLGDFILVGLYPDEALRQHRGTEPVLTLVERAMAVLSLRSVDDVILGAPWKITRDLLTTMNIAVVVSGRRPDTPPAADDERLLVAAELGLLADVSGRSSLSTSVLLQRCIARQEEYRQRNSIMLQKELDYVEAKSYVPEV